MAGSLGYRSAVPAGVGVFPRTHVGDGANAHKTQGLGVEASVSADRTWMLEFMMPPTLPTGTAKLRIQALADAVTGAAKVNPKTASIAAGEDPSAATLTAEGTTTITWSTNDDDEYQQALVTLDAVAPVASEVYLVHFVAETASWTLAVISTWLVEIIWE